MMEERVSENTKLKILKVIAFVVVFLMVGVSFNSVVVEAGDTSDEDDDGLTEIEERNITAKENFIFYINNYEEPAVPETPSGFQLKKSGSDFIEFSWDECDNASKYKIYNLNKESEPIGTTYRGDTVFKDEGLEPNNTYYYEVEAINYQGGNRSDHKNSTWSTTSLGLQVKRDTTTYVKLDWDTFEIYEDDEFHIFRKLSDDSSFEKIGEISGNYHGYFDSTVEQGHFYDYMVRIYNTTYNNYFDNSTIVTAQTYFDNINSDEKENNFLNVNNEDGDSKERGPFGYQSWYIDNLDLDNGYMKSLRVVNCTVKLENGDRDTEVTFELKNRINGQTVGVTRTNLDQNYTKISFDFDNQIDTDDYFDNPDKYKMWSLKIYTNNGVGVTIKGEPQMIVTKCSEYRNKDTDGDGISDGEEHELGSNIFHADFDEDGLIDPWEFENNTDPNRADTDGDGLDDLFECEHTGKVEIFTGEIGVDSITEKTGGLDPNDKDTDGDGLLDGEEYYGYNVTYFYDGNLENNKSYQRTNDDPIKGYKNRDGDWTDIDEDGIIDAIEDHPGAVMLPEFDNVENITNIRKYYSEFQDDDSFADHFNKYIQETFKPVLKKLKVENHVDTWGMDCYADITIKAYDGVNLSKIELRKGDGTTVNLDLTDGEYLGEGVYKFETEMDIDYEDYINSGYDLDVSILDGNGNVFSRETHINSLIQDFTDFIVGWISDAVDSAVDTAVDLANSLKSWVDSQISSLFSSVVNPIIAGLQDWANGIQTQMENFFAELAKWDEVGDGDESEDLTMQAGTGLMLSFVGQQDKAEQVTDVLSTVMNFIKPFQKYVSPFGAVEAIGGVLGETSFLGDLESYYNTFQEKAGNKIGEGIQWLLESTFGSGGLMSVIGVLDEAESIEWNMPSISLDGLTNFLQEVGLLSNTLISSLLDAISDLDLAETANGIVNAIFALATVISIQKAVTNNNGHICLILGMLNLVLQAVSWTIGNVATAFLSFLLTLFDGFVGAVKSGETVSLVIGTLEFVLAFVPFFTWSATEA